MNLTLCPERLAVCQLAANTPLPDWATAPTAFCSITRTPEEWSVVCAERLVPAGVKQEGGWQAFKVDGPLDFALTGILASIAEPLAKAGISLYALSTYNTDYILVKVSALPEAVRVLRGAGHNVRSE